MSETQFWIFQNMITVAEIFVYAGSLAYFLYPFLARRGKSVQKKILRACFFQ